MSTYDLSKITPNGTIKNFHQSNITNPLWRSGNLSSIRVIEPANKYYNNVYIPGDLYLDGNIYINSESNQKIDIISYISNLQTNINQYENKINELNLIIQDLQERINILETK